jgi:hypothetical protein
MGSSHYCQPYSIHPSSQQSAVTQFREIQIEPLQPIYKVALPVLRNSSKGLLPNTIQRSSGKGKRWPNDVTAIQALPTLRLQIAKENRNLIHTPILNSHILLHYDHDDYDSAHFGNHRTPLGYTSSLLLCFY